MENLVSFLASHARYTFPELSFSLELSAFPSNRRVSAANFASFMIFQFGGKARKIVIYLVGIIYTSRNTIKSLAMREFFILCFFPRINSSNFQPVGRFTKREFAVSPTNNRLLRLRTFLLSNFFKNKLQNQNHSKTKTRSEK